MLLRLKTLTTGLTTGLTPALFLLLGSAPFAAAQDNYQIRPGDVLQIEVLEDSSLNRSALVLPDGTISFPMAGTVSTKGQSVEALRQSLATALAPNFAAAPSVYVSIAKLSDQQRNAGVHAASRKIEAYVLGEVAAPGQKSVKRGTTILQFLAESGGLTRFAAEKRIELHRTDPNTGTITTYLFNYRTPRGGNSRISGSTKLATGDVVKIPRRRLFE